MPVAVAMGDGDIIPSVTELEEATGNTSRLDDSTTALDNGVDSSPEAVAMEETTPALMVSEGAATVEGCNDTLVDSCMVAVFEAAKLDDTPAELDTVADIDWLVVFWETMKLDPSPTAVAMEDSTPTPTELKLGAVDMYKVTVADGSKPDVFTAETVSLRLGTPEGETADELVTAFVWLTTSPAELENEEDCRVKFTTELLL